MAGKVLIDSKYLNKDSKLVFASLILLGALSLVLFSACSETPRTKEIETADSLSNKKDGQNCIVLLRDAMRMDSILMQQNDIDQPSARQAIKAFADYANFCGTDSLSPFFLIKCAQVARAINAVPQAKVVLEKCIRDYPQFVDRPAAIFLLAQLYDEVIYLNDENEAKRLYEQIISEYPSSDWAHSAKGALTFIGKSDLEIMNTLKSRKTK